jgi:hypothetical protein
MASSNWNVSEFLSNVQSTGLAKPCRFEVLIDTPRCVRNDQMGRLVSLYCEQASLPFQRIVTSRQQIFGPAEYLPVGVDFGGENFVMQFFVDRDMKVKRFFDLWMQGVINANDTVYPAHTANYSNLYKSTITISQLNEADEETYKVQLIDAYPISVQQLQLDAGTTNQVHRLNVSFVYYRWIEKQINFNLQVDNISTDPAKRNIFDINTNIGPNFRGGYYGEQVEPSGGGYDPSQDR